MIDHCILIYCPNQLLFSEFQRDIFSERIDLSQAALQAVGYCIYQDRIVR